MPAGQANIVNEREKRGTLQHHCRPPARRKLYWRTIQLFQHSPGGATSHLSPFARSSHKAAAVACTSDAFVRRKAIRIDCFCLFLYHTHEIIHKRKQIKFNFSFRARFSRGFHDVFPKRKREHIKHFLAVSRRRNHQFKSTD